MYDVMLRIQEILNGITVSATEIKKDAPKLEAASISARKYYKALTDLNHILSHLGVGNLDEGFAKIQKAMFAVMALNAAANTMMLGPAGLVLGALAVGATMFSLASWQEGY